jgi:hypothetical protein
VVDPRGPPDPLRVHPREGPEAMPSTPASGNDARVRATQRANAREVTRGWENRSASQPMIFFSHVERRNLDGYPRRSATCQVQLLARQGNSPRRGLGSTGGGCWDSIHAVPRLSKRALRVPLCFDLETLVTISKGSALSDHSFDRKFNAMHGWTWPCSIERSTGRDGLAEYSITSL